MSSEIVDSTSISCLAVRVSGIVSVGLNALAFVNETIEVVEEVGAPVLLRHLGVGHLDEREVAVRLRLAEPRRRPAAVELPEPEAEHDHVRPPDLRAAEQQLLAVHRGAAGDEEVDQEAERRDVRERDDRGQRDRGHAPLPRLVDVPVRRRHRERDQERQLEHGHEDPEDRGRVRAGDDLARERDVERHRDQDANDRGPARLDVLAWLGGLRGSARRFGMHDPDEFAAGRRAPWPAFWACRGTVPAVA